ncbi:hypothetical protein KKB71_02465 [Patescibacteria group bacterium]|nr:hypothetical protein [Patescibacteria group bacterium]MBU2219152.1 hypothetical protein [Patescibacteria group bacterium]
MDKRKLLVILAVVIAFAIAVWLLFFYEKPLSQPQEEIIMKEQSEEAAKQIEEFNKQPFTQEQLDEQSAEAQKQLEEFNKGQ